MDENNGSILWITIVIHIFLSGPKWTYWRRPTLQIHVSSWLLCKSPPLYCETMWPPWTVSALSCSFRNTQRPHPLLPHSVPALSLSLSHKHSSLKPLLMGSLMVRAGKSTCPGETGGSRLVFSLKGSRWIPPRAKWKHNTEPQTTDVKQPFSGTLYQSLSLKVTSSFFLSLLLVLCIKLWLWAITGLISWIGNTWYPCSSETAGLLWLHLCLAPVAV